MNSIIVAEDEPILSSLIKTELESSGYTVRVANNGKEVWDMLQDPEQTMPDIILSDLLMPEMTGYELLEKLKGDERFKHIPCLVLSNSGQIDDLNRAFKLGASDVLIKANFNPDQLTGKVAALLPKPTAPHES